MVLQRNKTNLNLKLSSPGLWTFGLFCFVLTEIPTVQGPNGGDSPTQVGSDHDMVHTKFSVSMRHAFIPFRGMNIDNCTLVYCM